MSATAINVIEPPPSKLSIGRVFERAFAAVRDNAALMIGIALVVGAVPYALKRYVLTQFLPNATDPRYFLNPKGWALLGAAFLVELLVSAIVHGAIIHVTLAHSEGRRASLAESLTVSGTVFPPLAALSLLYWLGLAVAFVLLIVPGLALWCTWFVAKPALVAERAGIARAFGRSRELTAFEGWKLFGILAVLLATGFVASQLAQLILRSIERPNPVVTLGNSGSVSFTPVPLTYLLLMIPVSTLAFVLWPTIEAAAYIELRNAKHGPEKNRLEEVFA